LTDHQIIALAKHSTKAHLILAGYCANCARLLPIGRIALTRDFASGNPALRLGIYPNGTGRAGTE